MYRRIFRFYQDFRKRIFGIYFTILVLFAAFSVWDYIPNTISVQRGEAVTMGGFLPVTRSVKQRSDTVESFGILGEKENGTDQVLSTNVCGTYQMQVRLLGMIPVKDVTVHIVEEEEVIPCGVPIGIYVHTKGVLVVDTGEVETENGTAQSPAKHILKSGDYITAVDGKAISEKEELVAAINGCGGQPVTLLIDREEEEIPCVISPVDCGSGQYRIGAWVRDDMAGIGTLTYIDGEERFGALGHSISDMDTASMVKMSEGKAYLVDIIRIIKGEKGNPGELVGQIAYQEENVIGEITENNANGIFGIMESLPDELRDAHPTTVGYKQQIQCGEAEVCLELDGESKTYKIEIESIDMNPSETNKSIRFRVTDQQLIEKTGGIVQGLSGAPILQNGKIVGAVTHVFVSDPLEGYGIFIEDML